MKNYLNTFILFVLVSLTSLVFGQKSINNYKYVIVSDSYDFVEGKDRYQLNSLTKFLFNKYGFTAFMITDSLPEDLFDNRCLALYADAEKLPGKLFKTEVKILLKDCYGQLVHESEIGATKEKMFEKAYNYAIRNAFESFEFINYKYQPTSENANAQIVVNEKPKEDNQDVSTSEIVKKSTEIGKVSEIKTEEKAISPEIIEETTYYAQTTADGYRIIDNEPKLIMILLRTAKENTFTVKDKNAIVYLENGFWYYSEISEGKTLKKVLNLKFYD